MPKGIKKEKVEQFVTREYFDEKLTQILDIVQKVATPAPAQTPEVKAEEKAAAPSDTPIPPDWNEYIDENLGKDFGRVLSYPKNSPGQLHLSVPKELSNASPLQWSFYKVDMRNVVIDPREGFEGIKKAIDLIAKNLKLDPRTVAERNLKQI